MASKKGHLGFDTTATELEEKYASAVEAIVGVKGDWAGFGITGGEMLELATKAVEMAAKSTDPKDVEWLRFWMGQRASVLILVCLAKLGCDIADVHKRVADCEKRISEIKAAL